MGKARFRCPPRAPGRRGSRGCPLAGAWAPGTLRHDGPNARRGGFRDRADVCRLRAASMRRRTSGSVSVRRGSGL
jgi:hypothetical protein